MAINIYYFFVLVATTKELF